MKGLVTGLTDHPDMSSRQTSQQEITEKSVTGRIVSRHSGIYIITHSLSTAHSATRLSSTWSPVPQIIVNLCRRINTEQRKCVHNNAIQIQVLNVINDSAT